MKLWNTIGNGMIVVGLAMTLFGLGYIKGRDSHCKETTFKYTGYETSDTNYHNGQVLYPDYVHLDTLVVVNADSLNWCMANYDIASDGDIQDVLSAYTKKY